jgi:hypothetical protein
LYWVKHWDLLQIEALGPALVLFRGEALGLVVLEESRRAAVGIVLVHLKAVGLVLGLFPGEAPGLVLGEELGLVLGHVQG